jgi:hypothetical protein
MALASAQFLNASMPSMHQCINADVTVPNSTWFVVSGPEAHVVVRDG